jgi:hypothetical protein
MSLFVESLKFSKNVMLHPGEETKRAPNNYRELFTYLIYISIFFSALSLTLSLIIFYAFPNSFLFVSSLGGMLPPILPGVEGILLSAILFPIGIIAGTVVGSALIHVFGKSFGIYKRPFINTITPYAYGIAPIAIIGWIPGVSVIAGVWAFIVTVFALSNHQGISKTKALVSIIVPAAIISILAVSAGLSDFYMAGSLSALVPRAQFTDSNAAILESLPRVIIDYENSICYPEDGAIIVSLKNLGTSMVEDDFVLSFGSQQISERPTIYPGSSRDIIVEAFEYDLDLASGTSHTFVLHAASFPQIQLSQANIVC